MEAFTIEDQAFILDRSEQLASQHRKYLDQHPEITQLFHDLLTNCLVNKVRQKLSTSLSLSKAAYTSIFEGIPTVMT